MLGTGLCAQAGPDVSSPQRTPRTRTSSSSLRPRSRSSGSTSPPAVSSTIHATKFLNDAGATFVSPGRRAAVPGRIQSRDFTTTHDIATINGRAELGYKILPYLSVFIGLAPTATPTARATAASAASTTRPALYGVPPGRVQPVRQLRPVPVLRRDRGHQGGPAAHDPRPHPRAEVHLALLQPSRAAASTSMRSGRTSSPRTRQPRQFTGHETLYQSGWVGTVEGGFGYDLKLTRNFDVTVESGYGYDTRARARGAELHRQRQPRRRPGLLQRLPRRQVQVLTRCLRTKRTPASREGRSAARRVVPFSLYGSPSGRREPLRDAS